MRPADLARTTTLDGREAPYVVRIETGTINRAVYQIAMLHDPAGEPDSRPVAVAGGVEPASRLHVRRRLRERLVPPGGDDRRRDRRRHAAPGLRGGLGQPQRLRQQLQRPARGRDDDDGQGAVRRGLRRAAGSPSAGGCSGGSYQNHQIADNYPGLLDGIIPGCSFPDVISGTIPFVTDAAPAEPLLRRETRGCRSPRSSSAP